MSERQVTVTVKYGGGYADPWVVFKGTVAETQEDMAVWFGISEDDRADMDGHDLLTGITGALKAGKPRERKPEDQAPAEPVQITSESIPVVETDEVLLKSVQLASSVEELTSLWEKNQAKFDAKIIKAASERKAAILAAQSNNN